MYLDPEAKIDMSLDEIIYHERQRQQFVNRMLSKKRNIWRNDNNYRRNMTYWTGNNTRTPNWYNYRNSLNRVKWFYYGQRHFNYRSRYQNYRRWNRVKNWAAQQQQVGEDNADVDQDYKYGDYDNDDLSSCCLSTTFSTISKSARRRLRRKRNASLSTASLSFAVQSQAGGFKRPEIPYKCMPMEKLKNLIIKVENTKILTKQIKDGSGAHSSMTLNERFTF